ncbi:MAG: hypothetical protein A2W90_24510 [Bacteroidetes bacterium GWF2_42_66]|nr:MAG: hypothetical protein A2W92_09180 [Bacteroidetes bacterium GWA2_42_15]OFX97910.1 MAG: hypothetical protein A2W89_07585 [Bacteroidetes bacterium GWE2_42_39]OFY45852.1 MAG: hypothetical protein A2W90_24510 [Bacteroidetes bacterium GWF2_42_66]HBL74645.1 hypothetical protein [Prolixibacteraceae bacterium]HCU60848.1 hypothetical protein [Prolixibacteraceae bacterium]
MNNANQELKTGISSCVFLKKSQLLNPPRGSVYGLLHFPALRTGLFKLNHIRGFKEKIPKGFKMNNLGCKPVATKDVQNRTPKWVQ